MLCNKAYRFCLYPNPDQKEQFAKTFGCVRYVYSTFLMERKKAYETEERTMTTTRRSIFCKKDFVYFHYSLCSKANRGNLSKMFMKEKGNKIYEIAKDTLGSSTEKLLEEMIKETIKNGDFKEEFSKDFLVRTISYLFVHFDEILYKEEDFELQRMIKNLDHYVDFMRGGLGRSE